ncbi:MAG: hypothetical protein GX306_02730 [Clostridiales bacterium]|jgi:hypothetical protein|nr:hypothetical protein [Clostridiales bacterium]
MIKNNTKPHSHSTLEQSSVIIPLTTSEPDPILPPTLQLMKKYDYVAESTTGLSDIQLPFEELQEGVAKYGMLHTPGMPFEEYKEAMNREWIDVTDYDEEPEEITVDITETMNYDIYVETLKKLSRYDGVYLYQIGESTEGRDLYAIEIDMDEDRNNMVFMFTGQIHAREFAGGTFLVKMFADLVQKAQTDKDTMNMLYRNKFVAVPIINVDGREALIKEPEKWKSSGQLWKAYTNGIDGNRNFPTLSWGQVSKGNKLNYSVASKPGFSNYGGRYAGSNKETKAMMKWLYHYTVVEQAECLIDMHQQGAEIYAGKGWGPKRQSHLSVELRDEILSILNAGKTERKYKVVKDEPKYGLTGRGASITDYAFSISAGGKFSPAMGFCVLPNGKKEVLLMQINDMDHAKFKIKAPNKTFKTITIEIGKGAKYLGNSEETRQLLAEEYWKYNFGVLMECLPLIN